MCIRDRNIVTEWASSAIKDKGMDKSRMTDGHGEANGRAVPLELGSNIVRADEDV